MVEPFFFAACSMAGYGLRKHPVIRRPAPGSLWGGQPQRLTAFRHPRLALAHADLPGFSLFDEAQYRGVRAAEVTLAALRRCAV